MRKVFATEYGPGEFQQIPPAAAKQWLHLCLDKVKEGEPFWYERDGNSLVIAVRMPDGKIHWFDCQMRVWGGEEPGAKAKPHTVYGGPGAPQCPTQMPPTPATFAGSTAWWDRFGY